MIPGFHAIDSALSDFWFHALGTTASHALPVSPDAEGVVSLPSLAAASSCVIELMALTKSTRLLACRCQPSRLTMLLSISRSRLLMGYFDYLVDRLDDPIDSRIFSNNFVLRVDQNNFKVFVSGVLIDPIRVEHAKVGASTSNTFLGC